MVAMVKFNPELAKSTPTDVPLSQQTSNGGRPGSVYSVVESPVPSGTASRHASVSSRRSFFGGNSLDHYPAEDSIQEEIDTDDELPVGHHFTYIPPNPKQFYKRLVEYCLVSDLETMLSPEVDDNDEVSLGILSPPHLELLNECALRWRIGQPYRVTCFLDLVKQFYERNDVPMECIPEALQGITKAMHDIDLDKWPVQDVRFHSSSTITYRL